MSIISEDSKEKTYTLGETRKMRATGMIIGFLMGLVVMTGLGYAHMYESIQRVEQKYEPYFKPIKSSIIMGDQFGLTIEMRVRFKNGSVATSELRSSIRRHASNLALGFKCYEFREYTGRIGAIKSSKFQITSVSIGAEDIKLLERSCINPGDKT